MSDYLVNLVRRGAGLAPRDPRQPSAAPTPAADGTDASFTHYDAAAAIEASDATVENPPTVSPPAAPPATAPLPAVPLSNAPARPAGDSIGPASTKVANSAPAHVSPPPSIQRTSLATSAPQPATAVPIVPAPTLPTAGGGFAAGNRESVASEPAAGDASPRPDPRPSAAPPAAHQPPPDADTIAATAIRAAPAEVNAPREAVGPHDSLSANDLVRALVPAQPSPAARPDRPSPLRQTAGAFGLEPPPPDQPFARMADGEPDGPHVPLVTPTPAAPPAAGEPALTTTLQIAPPAERPVMPRAGAESIRAARAPAAPTASNVGDILPGPSPLDRPPSAAAGPLAPAGPPSAAASSLIEPARANDAPFLAAVRPLAPNPPSLPSADRNAAGQTARAEPGMLPAEVVPYAMPRSVVQPSQPPAQPRLRLPSSADRPPRPSVQVRIGTLEIRAGTPETPAPASPPPRPAPPSLGFDDYRSIRN